MCTLAVYSLSDDSLITRLAIELAGPQGPPGRKGTKNRFGKINGCERACKPGSVTRSRCDLADDHLSLHDDCSPPHCDLPECQRDGPPRVPDASARPLHSVWSSSGWGLPSRSSHLDRWCALTTPFHPYHASECNPPRRMSRTVRRSTLCCTIP